MLWSFVAALIASVALLPWVTFDFNPMHLRNPNAPAMRALSDLTRDPDRTPNTIDVLAGSEGEARGLTAKLSKLPEVSKVLSIDSFIPEGQPAKLASIEDTSLLLDVTLNPLETLGRGSADHSVDAVSADHVSGCLLAAKYWRLPPGKPPPSAPSCAARRDNGFRQGERP